MTRAGVFVALALLLPACGGSAAQPSHAPEPASPDADSESMQEQQQPAPAGAGEGAPLAPMSEPGSAAPRGAPAPARGRMPSTTDEAERSQDVVDESGANDLVQLQSELDRALSLRAPDCPNAAFLRDRICELSEALCRLAADHPGDARLGGRCEDGRARCERARSRVGASCPER